MPMTHPMLGSNQVLNSEGGQSMPANLIDHHDLRANFNKPSFHGALPLHLAGMNDRVKSVELLIQLRSDVNALHGTGWAAWVCGCGGDQQ